MKRFVAVPPFAALARSRAARAGAARTPHPAGGAFVRPQVGDPGHDPRSLRARREGGTGRMRHRSLPPDDAGLRALPRAARRAACAAGPAVRPVR
ncbi:hypothetical protein J2X36_003820 [Methylobacterium sp. BE186]|nr:hypothetical protein [Methylobacterium sp. BE186]